MLGLKRISGIVSPSGLLGESLGGIVLLNTNERIGQMDYKRTAEAKAETKRRDEARKAKYGNGAKK